MSLPTCTPRSPMRVAFFAALAALFLLVFVSLPAAAATLAVDDVPGCDDVTGLPAYCHIQAAIDAAAPGDTINVFPGAYHEMASNRFLYDGVGPYQFGIFVPASKGGLTIQGVHEDGVAVASAGAAIATVTTDATNNFGPSGLFIEGDNTTVAGLRIGANSSGQNKTVEVIGDNFVLRNTVIADVDGSVYLNDWRYVVATNTSHVQAYRIEGNIFEDGVSLDIASGAGFSGPVSNRVITNNKFTLGSGDTWPSISFSGSGTGVPWFTYSVGGAIILGNEFVGGEQLIRARGTYDNSQFDWASYWTGNTFERGAVALVGAGTPFDVRTYSYTSGSYIFNDVRRIGAAIQSEIDHTQPGDTVRVAAGTYTEQLSIAKNLTLTGAGASTKIVAPATMAIQFATSANYYPVVTAKNAPSVHISNLVVDGAGRGNSFNRFVGIAYYNAGGSVVGTEIKAIRETPFSGNQHGVALFAYNSDGATRNLAVRNNYIHDFQKNGMALNNSGASVLSVQVIGNRVEGAGATSITAQNGIQVYRTSGTLDGYIDSNIVKGIGYDAPGWVATSILNFYADVDISNNAVTDGHVGIYNIDAQGAIAYNKIDVVKIGQYAWGIIATDPPQAVPSPYDPPVEVVGVASLEGLADAVSVASATDMPVNISNNVVTFSGPDNSSTYGIEADAGYGARNIAVRATYNTVAGFDVGMEFYQCAPGCTSAVFTEITANFNNLAGNTGFGMRSNASYLTANGENNWWGAANGPSGAGGGSGTTVSQFIDFDPWLGSAVAATLAVQDSPIVLQRTDPHVINVPVLLNAPAGDQLSSVAFSVNYDEACLSTSAARVSGLPAGFQTSIALDAADTDGELDVAIWDQSEPLDLLPAGTLLSIEFDVLPGCWGTDRTVAVLFGNQPAPSFGNTAGQTVFRTSAGANILLDFNSPATAVSLTPSSVPENQPIGTTVGVLGSDDPDAAGDTYTFSLVAGAGDADNAAFTIDGNQLKTASSVDFEVKSSYSIRVQVSDGKGGLAATTLTVSVINANDTPTDISLSNNTVAEASPAGTPVGTLSSVDQDAGESFTYAMASGAGDSDNGAFVIVGNTLQINVVPDFDAKPSYSIRVRSTDSGGLFVEKLFTINVIDRSEVSLPAELDYAWVAYSGNVPVPVRFEAKGNAVRAASFTVEYNEACLTFAGMSGLPAGWSGTAVGGAAGAAVSVSGATNLASGVALVLNFSANDSCTSGTVSPLTFAGTTLLQNGSSILPVRTIDGALHIVANDSRGDCNSDDLVNAADFVAEVLETFDADTGSPAPFNHWLYVHLPTFNGSALGCDANTSATVDVADILCTVLVVFGDNSCTLPVSVAADGTPAVLSTRGDLAATGGTRVAIPVSLRSNGGDIAGAAFRFGFDPAQATLDLADADEDGIPDAIAFGVPEDLMRSAQVDVETGYIDFAVADLSLPLYTLPDDVLVTIELEVKESGSAAPVAVTLTHASLGNTKGINVPVEIEVLGQEETGRSLFLPEVSR